MLLIGGADLVGGVAALRCCTSAFDPQARPERLLRSTTRRDQHGWHPLTTSPVASSRQPFAVRFRCKRRPAALRLGEPRRVVPSLPKPLQSMWIGYGCECDQGRSDGMTLLSVPGRRKPRYAPRSRRWVNDEQRSASGDVVRSRDREFRG
jgi:hypothetical protein